MRDYKRVHVGCCDRLVGGSLRSCPGLHRERFEMNLVDHRRREKLCEVRCRVPRLAEVNTAYTALNRCSCGFDVAAADCTVGLVRHGTSAPPISPDQLLVPGAFSCARSVLGEARKLATPVFRHV